MITFKEFIEMKEGLWLADKNAKPGMSLVNTTQYTNAEREKLRPTPPKLKAISVKKDPALQIPANLKSQRTILKAILGVSGSASAECETTTHCW